MKNAFRTIRGRMLFWVCVVTIPIYAGALYMSYRATAQHLEQGAERDADELATRLAAELDTVIRPIEGGVRTVARQLEEVNPPPEQYPQRIRGILSAWPEVYGSTIALEVRRGDPATRPWAPYYFRHAGGISSSDLALASYDYARQPWYRRAADSLQPVWSTPYFDAGGGETWMVTYSVPFFLHQDDLRLLGGVVTADLDLDWVRAAAARVGLGPIGVGWLASPPAAQTFVTPIGATAQRLAAARAPLQAQAALAAAERMLARGASFALQPATDGTPPNYLAVRDLATLHWRLVLAMPRDQLLADARHLLLQQLELGAAGLLLLIAAISFVAAGISRPIHRLAEQVSGAEEGNLDFELPATTARDETGVLTDALRRLRDSLRRHVELRAESLAREARLAQELQIAANIQQSMLPGLSTRLPPSAQVAAALVPAKQVGGDLYDYFVLRDGSLLFAIGDVSDKGVPAALFMARTMGLLRALGNSGLSPEQLLSEVNARLVDGNDACMFVTLGCGVLESSSGRLRYASAGHDAPLVRHVDGSVVALAAANGPAMGIESPAEYVLTESCLAPGDMLLLYTDGVTEAEAGDGVQFGVERLGKLLTSAGAQPPDAHVRGIVAQVAAKSADFQAFDDATVLAVTFNPRTVTSTVEAGAERWRIDTVASDGGIRQAQVWLRNILSARALDAARISEVELVAEEVLTNIVRAAGRASVAISVDCALGEQIVLRFRDDGAPFDPLSQQAPALDAAIAERSVGGLGIHLIRELAIAASYAREGDHNLFEVRLRRSPDPPGAPA